MSNRKNIESILEQSKQNKGGFKLPENYFDQLQQEVSAKINEQETKIATLPKGPGKSFAALLIAASFAMIFFLVQPAIQDLQSNTPALSFAEYSAAEINEYLEENTEMYDLVAYAETEGFDIVSESNDLSYIENNSLGEFLIDESEEIDLNDLYNN